MTKPTKEILEKHNAFYKPDSDFSAIGRLRQSQWRERKEYPAGKLGNYLTADFAIKSKANYLTDKIKTLVQYEVYKSSLEGKLISEPRIWDNLLSSQPLCFNLFGELHFDLKLATKYFKKLFPTRVNKITAIKFEHSPGRGNADYTGDHSAFDVFVEYVNEIGKKGFIGIEVKYAENLKDDKEKTEATFQKHKEQYLKFATTSKLFPASSIDKLKQTPLQQIWRDHLLSIATMKDYDEGFFVFLFPSQNKECQIAVDNYIQQLNTANEEKNGFYSRHLDEFITTLKQLHKADWTTELEERYLGINL
jgi:hypothetical protein